MTSDDGLWLPLLTMSAYLQAPLQLSHQSGRVCFLWSNIRPAVSPGVAQSDLQLLFLLLPTRVLRLRPFLECRAHEFECACPFVMFPLGLFNRCLGLRDCLLTSLALLRRRGFFLAALAFALPLFSLERH